MVLSENNVSRLKANTKHKARRLFAVALNAFVGF
jgi:hypothetical protein